MLTRLKVSGFKNLVDVDVSFGPFTCIAGANGVGKSNLFDAIRFLSTLADQPLIEAATTVRGESTLRDVRGLFHRVGDHYSDTMSFEVEMVIPAEGENDLRQHADAKSTFLRYSLDLAYRIDDQFQGGLEILREELTSIRKTDARNHLHFHYGRPWLDSVILSKRRGTSLIFTEGVGAERVIKVHQESNQGRTLAYKAAGLPRTLLSIADAAERPTSMLARREMQSWRLLQLEPSALRGTDTFFSSQRLGNDGAHLPAMLLRLSHMEYPGDIYCTIANRLAELIEDVHEIEVDVDERRQSLALIVKDRNGTAYPARALSDGTLRFLALAALVLDPEETGLICLEEPENGIHPARIPAILQLLEDIAMDTSEPVSWVNPLRQVIINTHSPSVVAQVDDDSLLVAELKERVEDQRRFTVTSFSCLPDTWRARMPEPAAITPRGVLLAYLNPTGYSSGMPVNGDDPDAEKSGTRVIDREDVRKLLSFTGE